MRVLYVTNFYKPAHVYGGPSRSIPAMCEGLAQAGAEVTVFTTNANGAERLQVPLGSPIEMSGVKVRYFALAGNRFFYSPHLAAAVDRHAGEFDLVDIDCLFAHGLGSAAAACRRMRVPYVVPLRGQLLPWSLGQHRWRKRLYLAAFGRRCLERAAGLHCTDEVEANAIRSLGFRVPAFIVPNPIAAERFANLPDRGLWRRHFGIPDAAFVFLLLGRLHEVKRPGIAVRCLAAAMRLHKPVHLLIAGPDEQHMAPQLRRLASSLDCGQQLHILPILNSSEMRQAFVDSDLLLMPSFSENFGMVAAEAMAAGLPVLCSESVPIGRWGARAGAAICVPAADPECFTRAACELISRPSPELRRMGERGRELIRTRFDTPVVSRQMLGHYRSIISSGAPIPAIPDSAYGVSA